MHRNGTLVLAAMLIAALAGCGQQNGQFPPPLPPPVQNPNPPLTPVPAPPNHEQQRADEAKPRLRGQLEQLLGEHPITFEPDSAVLTSDAGQSISRVAELVKAAPEQVRFEIAGNAANVDSPADGRQLSEQRARAVVDALVRAGVPADRLQPAGYGNSRATGDPSAARRVDVVVR